VQRIRRFQNNPDGATLVAGLIRFKGALYGTTENGGTDGYGTVFKVTSSGRESALYSFTGGSDGAYPLGSLVAVKGELYGTTSSNAGSRGAGSVFKMTPSGSITVLHQFGASGDASDPQAGLTYARGTFYGTTAEGGINGLGAVFAIEASGAESVLHSFTEADGEQPKDVVVDVNGTLYGTTQGGGNPSQGTVFAVTP
jgi:uncharacterized repeat protein (TIGR03803 family)